MSTGSWKGDKISVTLSDTISLCGEWSPVSPGAHMNVATGRHLDKALELCTGEGQEDGHKLHLDQAGQSRKGGLLAQEMQVPARLGSIWPETCRPQLRPTALQSPWCGCGE